MTHIDTDLRCLLRLILPLVLICPGFLHYLWIYRNSSKVCFYFMILVKCLEGMTLFSNSEQYPTVLKAIYYRRCWQVELPFLHCFTIVHHSFHAFTFTILTPVKLRGLQWHMERMTWTIIHNLLTSYVINSKLFVFYFFSLIKCKEENFWQGLNYLLHRS